MTPFKRNRILQGINADLRTRKAVSDGQTRKLTEMAAVLVTRMVAAGKIEAAARDAFMRDLAPALEPLRNVGDNPRLAMLVRELDLRARLRDWPAVDQVLGRALEEMITCGSDIAGAVSKAIIALDFNRRDQMEEAARKEAEIACAPKLTGHETFSDADIARFIPIFRQLFPDNPEVAIESADIIAGGFSKQTAFLSLSGCTTLPQQVVLRRDRANSALATTVIGEYELLRTLHGAGIAIAEPLGLYKPETDADHPFLVSRVAAGRNIGDYWDVTEPSESFARDLARQMARIHSLSPDLFPHIDGADIPTRDHVKAELEATRSDWVSLNVVEPVADAAFAWLYRNLDHADGRRTLVHRDIGCHNMLVDGGRITAILDWEISWIGNPARDIAYVREMVCQCIGWDDFVAEYVSAGGEMPNKAEMLFYSIWSEVKNLVWTAFTGQIFFSGLSDDLTLGYSGIYNHERLCHRLARKLSENA